jgi:hypothetical protein
MKHTHVVLPLLLMMIASHHAEMWNSALPGREMIEKFDLQKKG